MKNLVPLLLLLGGCVTPLNELYQQRGVCLDQGQICPELQDEINRREDDKFRREMNDVRRCPPRTIEYCSSWMRGCGNKWRKPTDQYACIDPSDLY